MWLRNDGGFTLDLAISCGELASKQNKMRIMATHPKLDSIDRAILNELQHEGRLSNLELAQRVHLSPSACLRRVNALE
jgi:hypothetical protein